MKIKIIQNIKSTILALILALGVGYVSAYSAWVAPTATPPGNNIDAPINIGGRDGTDQTKWYTQTKSGILNLAHLFTSDLTVIDPATATTSIPAGVIPANSVLMADGANTGKVKWGTSGDPSSPATAPTISSFAVSPASVELGGSFTVSGAAAKGTSCITQHRFFVVGSQGGAWTPLGCVSTAALSGPVATLTTSMTINPTSFYTGPGTYKMRWEVQDSSSQITSRDVTVTVTATTPSAIAKTVPVINSFTITPTSMTEGQNITANGTATKGASCIAQDRFFVVGSQGGVWTPRGCAESIILSGTQGTTQNVRSFYNNPGTYTMRWEVQDTDSHITSSDIMVTVTTGSGGSPQYQGVQGWNYCADEGQTCFFSGTKMVRFGANGSYVNGTFTNNVFCDNDTFGEDPIYGTFKHCDYYVP